MPADLFLCSRAHCLIVRDGKAYFLACLPSKKERRKIEPREGATRALRGIAPLGRERHSEHSGRAFTGVGAACHSRERSAAARRSAFFAERGLTGCDPHPYSLPASEWLGYGRRETYR